MSHLVLVSEVAPVDPEARGPDVEEGSEEQRPLLRSEATSCSTPSSLREDPKVSANYSLTPEASLPAQVKIYDAASLLYCTLRGFISPPD